jgi:O-antigen ligase
LEFLGLFLSFLGGICGVMASLAVFANDAYYFAQYGFTPSVCLFLLAFTLAYLPGAWGLAAVLTILPLSAGIPGMSKALLGWDLLAMPNPGLDLVAGLFLGFIAQASWKQWRKGMYPFNKGALLNMPWPVGLVLLMISLSVALAILRNLFLSATSSSLRGLIYNLIHFRPMDWHADYVPLGNWVAYGVAGALIILLIFRLREIKPENRQAWIFHPLMLGLFLSAAIGLIQASTGLGLSEAQLAFRKDSFGYAAMGMQPDLHAFAAHMLLGVVGLWGYFFTCKSKFEKYVIVLVFLICSIALLASKSRASLFIALVALVIMALVLIYRHSKKYFAIAIVVMLGVIALIISVAKVSQDLTIPGLGWIGELVAQIQSRRLDSLSDLGGMMGSRFEIWSAVANMFTAYPFMGVGEGEFYKLSSNISFARSEFLQLNRGENAHNYFLQVLAENGLIGIALFAIAFLVPYRACSHKKILLPALIGLLSLFLGNIFAHSFLVRENLLLASALLALLYLCSADVVSRQASGAESISTKGTPTKILISIVGIFCLLGAIREVYFSFGQLPFKAGNDCYVRDLPLYQDGWTSGAWEKRIPNGTSAIEISILPSRPRLNKEPLSARLEILSWEAGKGKVPVNVMSYQWQANELSNLKLDVPKQYYNSPNVMTVRLELSSCYTPRDLGLNTDSRRLGVKIENVRYHPQ